MEDGLSFVITDKAGVFERHVVAHRGAEATQVWNDVSQASFVLDDSDIALPAILAKGARARVLFNGAEEFRGRISATPGAGPEGHVTTYVESDTRKLYHWLGWQKPSAAITAQTDEYCRYSGPVETVVKNAIAANVARLGASWVVTPSLGRGPAVSVDFRMHPLADKLLPLLRDARLGFSLAYPGGVPTVDVRSPDTIGGVLDPSSGRIDTLDFSRRAPSATRAIVGGRGEGVERRFARVISSATESDWGDIIEVFVDARNLDETDDLAPDGEAVIAEGAARTSVSMELTEQPGFKYHSTYELGDIVPIRIGTFQASEVIQSITIKDDPDAGVTVTPVIGDVVRDEIHLLGKQLARLQARARNLGRR